MTKLLEQAIAKVKQLPDSEQERIAQLILESMSPQPERVEKQENLSKSSQGKLSEVLLLPELEDDEVLFERNNETGRDILL
jgi:K+/H+ antiporter YhaU regulatory subunit KhtT